MGNKFGKRKQVVDERYTKPQVYVHKDVDHKKLKKLILESKLAPCYPGDDDYRSDCEECPICFLYYPSLNRSRCCIKGICTECFLQMKNPNSTRPTQYPQIVNLNLIEPFKLYALNLPRCPFCKTSNYAVEYRGGKTREEKVLEQIEEQRVIEAKIRMRQRELQDDEEKMQQKMEPYSLNILNQQEMECSTSAAACHRSCDAEETIPLLRSYKRPPYSSANREEEFEIDLEDIMVMEAIWLSIQQNGKQRSFPDEYCLETRYAVHMPAGCSSAPSPSGGFACAIAALAERQQTGGEANGNMVTSSMYPENNAYYSVMDSDGTCPMARGWLGNDAVTGHSTTTAPALPPDDVALPECFEDQMMLAMAVSLAEARGGSCSMWDR